MHAVCVVHAGDSLLGKNIKLDHNYIHDATSHSLATMHHHYFPTDPVIAGLKKAWSTTNCMVETGKLSGQL